MPDKYFQDGRGYIYLKHHSDGTWGGDKNEKTSFHIIDIAPEESVPVFIPHIFRLREILEDRYDMDPMSVYFLIRNPENYIYNMLYQGKLPENIINVYEKGGISSRVFQDIKNHPCAHHYLRN